MLLLGAGGLGSPAALYLAAAGVGTIGIVDNDVVDLSNLQRQVAHSNDRIGVPKVDSAEISIHDINPDVKVEKYPVRLGADNIMEIIDGYDVVVDGLDNFPTRYLLNDASVRKQIPVVSASILGFEGQLSVFHPTRAPATAASTRRRRPPSWRRFCGAAGVLGVLPGVMGLLQSVEAIKLITGAGETMAGACSSTTRSAPPSPSSRSAATPTARFARASRARSPTRRWASSWITKRSAPALARLPTP